MQRTENIRDTDVTRDTGVTMGIQMKTENTRDTNVITEYRSKLRMYEIVT